MKWTMDKRKKKAFKGSLRSFSRRPGRGSRWPRRRRAARVTRGHLPPALLRVCPPVREMLTVRRVGDLPEVGAIGSRREGVLLVRARQIQGKHDTLAIGRPARLEREGAAGARVQPDRVLTGTVRVYDV